jgi:hypothetical protein
MRVHGLVQFTQIIEGLWGNKNDISSQHKSCFFDGTFLLHRHLDHLLSGKLAVETIQVYSEVKSILYSFY